jgi:hypothetical protein
MESEYYLKVAIEALEDRAVKYAFNANLFVATGNPQFKRAHQKYRELLNAAEFLRHLKPMGANEPPHVFVN